MHLIRAGFHRYRCRRGDAGSVSVEYAMLIVGVVVIGGLLVAVATSERVRVALSDMIVGALT